LAWKKLVGLLCDISSVRCIRGNSRYSRANE
jgi:hypothetical protein